MASSPALGTVLVIGGCGFIGYYLVRHLLDDEDCGAVYVFDRDIDRNTHDGAYYVRGLISHDTIHELVQKIQPDVILHAASPMAGARNLADFTLTNIDGTKAILSVAAQSGSVKALVYTSSCDVYANPTKHINIKETAPLWPMNDFSNEYNRTKAIGDVLVREANGPQLRTATLRLGHVYGVRQSQGLIEALEACEGEKPLIQFGRGDNLMEVVSADNVASAHVQAAKALVAAAAGSTEPSGRVDGEAFNISDGAPQPFWHHVKVTWGVVRGQEALSKMTVLPAWVMMVLVYVAEWSCWIFTLGMVKPPMAMRFTSFEYCTMTHTYDMDKARERLGFKPVLDHDATVAAAARWLLQERGARPGAQSEKKQD